MLLVSLIVAAVGLWLAATVVWWRLWRAHGSRPALALALTNGLLILIGLGRLWEMGRPADASVAVWLLGLAVALVQFGLAVGVFGGESG